MIYKLYIPLIIGECNYIIIIYYLININYYIYLLIFYYNIFDIILSMIH